MEQKKEGNPNNSMIYNVVLTLKEDVGVLKGEVKTLKWLIGGLIMSIVVLLVKTFVVHV